MEPSKFFSVDEEGKETVLNSIGVADYFGEIALMINLPRTASARAIEKTLLLCLKKSDFENFLTVAPGLKASFEVVAKQRTTQLFKKFDVPFFNAIPEGKLYELAKKSELEVYQPNTVIFSQGDPATSFYLIASGTLEVIIEEKEKKRKNNNQTTQSWRVFWRSGARS